MQCKRMRKSSRVLSDASVFTTAVLFHTDSLTFSETHTNALSVESQKIGSTERSALIDRPSFKLAEVVLQVVLLHRSADHVI